MLDPLTRGCFRISEATVFVPEGGIEHLQQVHEAAAEMKTAAVHRCGDRLGDHRHGHAERQQYNHQADQDIERIQHRVLHCCGAYPPPWPLGRQRLDSKYLDGTEEVLSRRCCDNFAQEGLDRSPGAGLVSGALLVVRPGESRTAGRLIT
jgi:hypothetical protein